MDSAPRHQLPPLVQAGLIVYLFGDRSTPMRIRSYKEAAELLDVAQLQSPSIHSYLRINLR
jgi:hypothetical protein